MIKNILHKGLKRFYEKGSISGITAAHQRRLSLILARLDAARCLQDMNLPGFDFHPLTGPRKGEYAISVNKNWSITFKFDGMDMIDVDYTDYH
jgi:proteic killer suppression protein